MLYQDALAYFKNKGDELAAGVVELQGCSIISPCPQYTKKQVSTGYWSQNESSRGAGGLCFIKMPLLTSRIK